VQFKADASHFLILLNKNPAPACLKPADTQIRKGLADYISGAQTEINGIDDTSVSEIQTGNQKIALGNTAFDNATKDVVNAKCQ
jgi:hypothetical protein